MSDKAFIAKIKFEREPQESEARDEWGSGAVVIDEGGKETKRQIALGASATGQGVYIEVDGVRYWAQNWWSEAIEQLVDNK